MAVDAWVSGIKKRYDNVSLARFFLLASVYFFRILYPGHHRRYNAITPVCWLVRSFVRYARCDFSKSSLQVRYSQNLAHAEHLCRIPLIRFERSTVKLNVEGHFARPTRHGHDTEMCHFCLNKICRLNLNKLLKFIIENELSESNELNLMHLYSLEVGQVI